MEIRRALKEDVNQLLDLLSQVLKIHAKLRPDIFVNGETKYHQDELLKMVDDTNNPIYVIGEGKKVYGYAFCQIQNTSHPHLLKKKRTFYILY